jgi:copper chaperone CopZ
VAAAVSVALAAGWWGIESPRETLPPHGGNPAQTSVRPSTRAEIKIEGMDCMMCAAGLQNKLRALQGVSKADVSYQDKRAAVEFDPAVISRARLVNVIEGDGFKVAAREASPQPTAPAAAR